MPEASLVIQAEDGDSEAAKARGGRRGRDRKAAPVRGRRNGAGITRCKRK